MAKYKRLKDVQSKSTRKPYSARGGIKTKTKQGSFGSNWVGERWLAVFEPSAVDTRLSRGRSYARGGQVVSVEIEKGCVKAAVQGSQLKPYDILITVALISDGIWEELQAALPKNASLVAKMMAGSLPQEFETLMKELGSSLFPNRLRQIKNSCECTDWSNPCKHTAAIYYLLCEEFERDPFLLLRLRGREKDELLSPLIAKSSEEIPYSTAIA